MSENELIDLTKKLIELNKTAFNSYSKVRETGVQGDFYEEVKPFADEVKTKSEEWITQALDWVKRAQPKHIHSIQLQNTVENIQMVSVKAFYPDTSLKRFKSHIQSVGYVLEGLLEELQKQ